MKKLTQGATRLAALALALLAAGGACGATALRTTYDSSSSAKVVIDNYYYNNIFNNCNTTASGAQITIPSTGSITQIRITSLDFAYLADVGTTKDHAPSAISITVDGVEYKSAAAVKDTTNKMTNSGSSANDRMVYSFAGVDCILAVGTSYNLKFYNADGSEKTTTHRFKTCDANGAATIISGWNYNTTYVPLFEFTGYAVSCVTLSGGSPTLSTLSGWDVAPQSDTADYVFSVTDDTELSVDSAKSATTFTFDVTSGKTLTLTGNTLTASEIAFTGEGVATTQNMSMFSGTLTGDGTLCYDMNNGTTKPSGIVCTSDDWAGMLWIKNGAYTGWNFNTAATGYIKYGSANSTLRLENVTCFLNATETVGFTLDLHGEGLKITNGNGYKVETVKKLTGSGTLAISGGSSYGNGFIIQDGSEFAGSINITTGNYVVNFADSGTYATSGKIIVGSGKTATVASGKTWSTTNQNGIEINGTLTLADSTSTLTGAISGSGTLVANQQFPVPGSSFTGTLTINGDPVNGTTTDATAIYGSTLNIASGQVGVSGNVTTLPDTINIASGATFVVLNASLASLSLDIGTWDGTLAFMNCTSLASLTIDAGTKRSFAGTGTGSITLPTGTTLSTVNIVLDEVKGDGGTITLTSATGLTAVEGRTYNFTVNRVDGTPVTGTYDSAASTVSYTPAISGAATDIDWDFTDGEDDDLEQKPSGVGKNADSTMTFYTDATDSTKTGVYIKHHPYITGAASFMGNNSAAMSVAVVGTMPATQNTIFLNVGSAYVNKYGLVFLTTATANEVLIGYNYGGTVTPITTMTVPNSSTARHSYIITKQDGDTTTTFTVYLDGIKWKTVTTDTKITFPSSDSGVQVGSDFGGNIRKNGYSAASDDVGVLNVLRVYGRIITDAEIAVYASTFPYVSPNGASSRTFAAAAEDWVEATDTDWTNTDSSGTTTQGTAPSAGASVTVTAAEATEITVSLASDTQYEALTINGSAVALKKGTNAGKLSVTGMTVVGAPVTVEYGAADFTGGPMTITEDGSITFDYRGYDISGIYTTTEIPLTSDVDEDSTKVFLTVPTATYQTATLIYESGHYAMRVTPVHEAGTELYYKSGYWSSTESSFSVVDSTGAAAPVFPGDVVVIDSTHATVSAAWVADTFPANVTSIRVAKDFTFHSGVSAAIFGGVTVAVNEGFTLTLNNSNSQNSITLGAVTLNGPGSVVVTDTIAVSGAVSGTAALTISGTVNVASGGSIANTLAGSGTLAFAAVPSSALTFGTWTGTVQLPAITSGAIIFNNYGTTGSTVYLTSMSSGAWIQADNTTIDPKLYIEGNMTLSTMSQKTYTFAEIDGPGALSFATSAGSQPIAINITKVAEGYSGTISSTLETPVTIATLDRAAGTTVTPGSKVLSTSSGVQASALTVGGVATDIVPVFDTDGLYVKAASVTKNDATTYHNTVADALTAAGSDAATITLLAPTDNAITIAPGQTLVNGNLTTGGVAGPNGYEVVNNNGTYTLVDNTAATWADAEDHKWNTATNWSTGYCPSQYTTVTFPASESAHVVKLERNSGTPRHYCASMVLNGDVEFQRNGSDWVQVYLCGNVTGPGKLKLVQAGLKLPDGVVATISCPVVCNAESNDNFFSGSSSGNETFTFSGAVDVVAGELKADYSHLIFNGPVTIRDRAYIKSYGNSTAGTTFNGGIIVPEGAAASLTLANNGGPHTIASTVTLGVGATLTIPNSTVTNDAMFVASAQGYHVVSTVSGATTVYSVEAIPSSVEIGAATFAYGVDFTNATVTVAVTETNASGVEYTLAIGGKNYTASADGGTTVTFNNVEIPRGAAYGPVSYNITSTASATTGTTSGSAAVADVIAAGWINENATTHGQQAAGGSWTNAEAVTYSEGKAAITDNRFEATTASTASRVVLEFNVCFSSVSDADVDGTAQAAIKLGESGGATTFMVLASNADWTPVSRGDFVPDASATYKVVMTIDYGNGSYGVTVGDNVLTNASGSANFPLAKSGATSVKNIDFAGSGTLTSMKGDQIEGYMVKDNAGHWYATIQAATQAYNSANGPYTVLHSGTAPSGWKIDETTKALIKLAKGFFFMAY